MMAKRPLPEKDAVHQVANAMRRLGFVLHHKSRTKSCYLRFPGAGPFEIRISDHKWSKFNVDRQAQVVKNVVMRPTTIDEVPRLAMEFAVGFFVRRDLRLGLLRTV
jgi:hypothetical protein